MYAPRPGSFRPGTRSPSREAKRSSSRCGARRPQPTQRLTGSATLALVLRPRLGRSRFDNGDDGSLESRAVLANQATPLLLLRLGIPRVWISPTLTLSQVSEILSLLLLPSLLLRLRGNGHPG